MEFFCSGTLILKFIEIVNVFHFAEQIISISFKLLTVDHSLRKLRDL